MSKLFILGCQMQLGEKKQKMQKLYVVEKTVKSYLFYEYDIYCPLTYISESGHGDWVEKMMKTVKPSIPILKTKLEMSIEEWFKDPQFYKDRYYFHKCSFYMLSDEQSQEFFKLTSETSIDDDYYGKQRPYHSIKELFEKSTKSLKEQTLGFKKAEYMIKLTKKMLS